MAPKPKTINFTDVYKTINLTRPAVEAVNKESHPAADDPADTGTKPPVWESVPGNTAGTGAGPNLGQSNPLPR